MKKKLNEKRQNFAFYQSIKKIILIMKLTSIILLTTFIHLHANVLSQTINYTAKDVSLETVFNVLKEQTGYVFFYNYSFIESIDNVNVDFRNISIDEALDLCLSDHNLDYFIENNTIVIVEKENSSIEKDPGSSPPILIKGKVISSEGFPLPGANVILKGTYTGTSTNEAGEFEVAIVNLKDTLIVSFLGYKSKEIIVINTDYLIITLELEVSEMEEIVVYSTGYQKIKPEQSTGSITSIETKEFETRINTTDFLSGLQNKIPGLLINNDIEFEGNSLFQIRGISTINGNKQPLIVVDGFPTELSLDMINPEEIESITVLKDAAATTVYGVRASNGVIVIERKKAKQGKVNVTFRTTMGFTPKEDYDRYRWDKDASNTIINYDRIYYEDMINPWDWDFITDPFMSADFNYTATGFIMAQQLAGVITEEEAYQQFEELGSYNNSKDYSRLFLRTAVTQTYNLNVSGGDKNMLYYLTANYTASELSQIKNDNEHFMLSGRLTTRFSDRFSLDLNTDFQEAKSNSVPIPDINNIYPYERLEDENGKPLPIYNSSYVNIYYNDHLKSIGLLDNLYYPLVDINEISDKSHTVNNRITANFRYDIGKGFSLNFGGTYESSRTDMKYLASENSSIVHQYINRYAQDGDNGIIFNIPQGSFLKQKNSSRESYTLRTQLNYDKMINENHSLNVILGGEMRDVLDKSSSAAYFGYSDQTLLQQPVDYNTLLSSNFFSAYGRGMPSLSYNDLFNQEYVDNRYISVYFNAVYSYKGKYSFSGSLRIEQSNLFGNDPKYKYKPLWSVGAAWNIRKENFMQDVNWLESLKLRVAYGFNGNVAKNALPQVIAKPDYNSLDESEYTLMLNLLSYANSSLRWEQTQNFNLGLDYSLFKNINGSIDYYIKKSTDLLAINQIDVAKGGAFALINQASILNSGLEITLNADWITRRKFNWNTGLVFSHNSSKVLEVYNELEANNHSSSYVYGSYSNYLEGYAVGAMFNYRYAGLDNTGAALIYDKDGNTKHYFDDDGGVFDLDYAGSSIPVISLGLSNRVDIGNFYIYCMINYYGGFKVRVPTPDVSAVRPLEGAGDYWKEPGDENDPDVLPSPTTFYYSNLDHTDKYTVNGAYLTLGDLTLSYSFRDSKWMKKTGIFNFEVRAQASNLFTVGFNEYNYSVATGSYAKSYLTPTYTIGLYVNF